MKRSLLFLLAALGAGRVLAGIEADVMVYLEDGKGNIVFKAKADGRGAFSFSGIKKGEYVLRTYGPGPDRGRPRATRQVVLGGPGFDGSRGSIHGSLESRGGGLDLHAYVLSQDREPSRRDWDRRRGDGRREARGFSLADRRIRPGESPLLLIRGGLPYSEWGQRYWVTVVRAGAPDSAWGLWRYLAPGDHEVRLQTPPGPGDYEVRVHDVYPRHSYKVIYRERLRVGGARDGHRPSLSFQLMDDRIRAERKASVRFDQPIPSISGQKYWITIAPAGSDDTTWGSWQYLSPGTVEARLKQVPPGRYEVRLHDLYPRNSYGVLQRAPLVVR